MHPNIIGNTFGPMPAPEFTQHASPPEAVRGFELLEKSPPCQLFADRTPDRTHRDLVRKALSNTTPTDPRVETAVQEALAKLQQDAGPDS